MKLQFVVFSIIFLFFTGNISSIAQQNYADSLEHIVNTREGTDKLEALYKLSKYMFEEKESIAIIDRFIEEANKQSDHKYLGTAYLDKADYYDAMEITDSVIYYVNKSKDELRKINDTISLATADFTLIRASLKQGKTELVLHLANKFLNNEFYKDYPSKNINILIHLYSSMGMAYLYSNRPKQAIESFRKGLETIKDVKREKDVDIHFYVGITTAALIDKDYKLATTANDSMYTMIENIVESNSFSQNTIDSYRFIYHYMYADIYLAKKEIKNARVELDRAASLLSDNIYEQYKYIYYYLEAQCYYEHGNYNRSLEYIEPALDYYKLSISAFNHFEMSAFKAKLLGAMNKSVEAHKIMETIYHQRDSINIETQIEEMDAFQTLYEVDKMKIEIEAKKAELRVVQITVIGFACIALLLGILFLKGRQNAKIQNKKNKKLYDQLVEMDIYAGQIRTLNKQKLEEENQSLAYRIDSYLKESEDFRRASFSRNDLALKLGTNRQYIADAVKDATGKTFNDYINDMRLDYARIQLIENQLTSIEMILTEAGFSTRATFNRLFRQRYGMTPVELRQVAMDGHDISDRE